MANDKTDKAEAAAIRRRWITLGELLAVAAVVISGLTFWNSYQERSSAEAEKASAQKEKAVEAQTLTLRGTADRKGESIALAALDPDQAIQSQTIAFPTALGVAAVDTVADPRIESGWFAKALLRVLDDRARVGSGDHRLPVAISTSFINGGAAHSSTAIYNVGYRIDEGGLLEGTSVRLRGLSLAERAEPEAATARLDALWSKTQPTISSSEKK